MDVFTLIFLVLGLSIDDFTLAFAIAIMQTEESRVKKLLFSLRIAGAFTISTIIISLLGWFVGIILTDLLLKIGSWLVLIAFVFVGIWIIREAIEGENEQKLKEKNIFSFWILILIGILGSIDEGVIGITYSQLDFSIAMFFILLATINFFFAIIGVYVGGIKSKMNLFWVKVMTGLFFILIGIKNWASKFF
ncbi:manganese efflux pump MntP [Candidatus Lokiarchaeum ossiferum]|uniref:Manganese efflux pump MntP n=1 Tax=Candidatus Lokiarchaeum ossiferum TaxID=2951803 RepID=A0ABY6HYD2_9ARCH|nr:manganese efflux pump MntP [Candidatus Lokiarchaeum sp. B-35]